MLKTHWKGLLLAHILALLVILPQYQPVYAQEEPPVKAAEDVKVQVNHELVQFQDAQPFLDENHTLYMPARPVADKLGYETTWEQKGNTIEVILKDDQTTVSLLAGTDQVLVNGEPTASAYKTFLLDGRLYVPFRLISNTFGIQTQWDGTNRIAILGADGKYHAPAWYKAQERPKFAKIIEAKATAYTAAASENGGWAGKDYFGNPLKLGTIAVDPKMIPLGSKVYIEGYSHKGLPEGGMYAVASDIGGSIKGNRVDIFVPQSQSEARRFGVQQVKIYVLNEQS